jgi:predicted nucleic acid-binding protein
MDSIAARVKTSSVKQVRKAQSSHLKSFQKKLDEWLRSDLPIRFEGRIAHVDGAVADEWGRLVARREADGRPFNAMDALIAATAHVHELTLVTRNVSDFKASLKSLLNPWT